MDEVQSVKEIGKHSAPNMERSFIMCYPVEPPHHLPIAHEEEAGILGARTSGCARKMNGRPRQFTPRIS